MGAIGLGNVMCNRLSQSFYNLQNGVVHCSVARKVRQECQRIVDQPEIMIKVVKVQVVREAAENKLMNDIAQRLVDLLRSGRAPRYRLRPMWTRNCHRRSYYLRDIERETVPHVAKVFASPDTVKQMAEEFERRAGANQRAANNELPKIVKRLEEIEAGTLQLVTGLERGSLPEGIIAERLQALEAERVALAEKRRIAESKVVKLAILPSALRKWHADLQFLAAKLHDGASRGSARRCGTCWIASSFTGAQAQTAKDRTARASGGSGWRALVFRSNAGQRRSPDSMVRCSS